MSCPDTNTNMNSLPEKNIDDEQTIDLFELLDTFIDAKWLIASCVAAGLAIGSLYLLMARPVYEASAMIQVEDRKGGAGAGSMADFGAMFNITSAANTEIEILKSRMVLGNAADELLLNVSAQPRYVPVIGSWLARNSSSLSEPGFMGFFKGRVSGNEAIALGEFNIVEDSAKETQLFRVRAGDKGNYFLFDDKGQQLLEGRLGIAAIFSWMGKPASIKVTQLQAKPGAEFDIAYTSRNKAVEDLQQDLKVTEKAKQSNILLATLQGSDAQKTTAALNAVARSYVQQNIQRKAAEAKKSLEFLDDFLPQLKKQLEKSESKYKDFRAQKNTFDLTTEGKLALEASADLQKKIIELQQKRKELALQFTDAHPSMQAIDSQLAALNKEMSSIAAKTKSYPEMEQDMMRLMRDVKVNSEIYSSLLASAQQMKLVREGQIGNVRLIDPAITPTNPVSPKSKLVLLAALMAGLFAGLGAALVRKMLASGISHADDLEAKTGLRVFANVPYTPMQQDLFEKAKKHEHGMHLLAVTAPDLPACESLRSFRTALQFAMLNSKSRILLFAAPTPNIGKSFISLNFAAILASSGKRVLLIDADMRKGYAHDYLGLKREAGLSELISTSMTVEQVIKKTALENMDFISTGVIPPNPAELLEKAVAGNLFVNLSKNYDLLIIDTPPVLAVSDTQILASSIETLFLIAYADVTTVAEVVESRKLIEQSGGAVTGVVFNGFNMNKKRYGYGGYQRYQYHYMDYKYNVPRGK